MISIIFISTIKIRTGEEEDVIKEFWTTALLIKSHHCQQRQTVQVPVGDSDHDLDMDSAEDEEIVHNGVGPDHVRVLRTIFIDVAMAKLHGY